MTAASALFPLRSANASSDSSSDYQVPICIRFTVGVKLRFDTLLYEQDLSCFHNPAAASMYFRCYHTATQIRTFATRSNFVSIT